MENVGAASSEVGLQDVLILAAHSVGVLRVAVSVGGEDAEVGVAEHLTRDVVVVDLMGRGQPDEPTDLRGEVGADARAGELLLGHGGGALLVVTPSVVHGVVEPDGKEYGVAVDAVCMAGGEDHVDPLEHLREVLDVVVTATRLAVGVQQTVPEADVARDSIGPETAQVDHAVSLAHPIAPEVVTPCATAWRAGRPVLAAEVMWTAPAESARSD